MTSISDKRHVRIIKDSENTIIKLKKRSDRLDARIVAAENRQGDLGELIAEMKAENTEVQSQIEKELFDIAEEKSDKQVSDVSPVVSVFGSVKASDNCPESRRGAQGRHY